MKSGDCLVSGQAKDLDDLVSDAIPKPICHRRHDRKVDDVGTVGIITYHWSDNYGALLQTFALQEVLRRLGHEPLVIDYHNWARTLRARSPARMLRRLGRRAVEGFFWNRERERRTEAFRKQYLSMTQVRYRDQDSLYENPPEFDAYITGSDQVWNPENNGFDQAYFLTFAPPNTRKISYAASFGVSTLPKRYWNDYRLWIRQLDHVSVREADGARILSEVAGVSAPVVVDPTLLMDLDAWRKISVAPAIELPYILCYRVTNRRQTAAWISDVAQQIARLTGWKVVSVGRPGQFPRRQLSTADVPHAGPQEFLGLMEHASAVVTDSFHGVVFSVSYQKPFFLGVDTQFPRNSRLTHLVEWLGLHQRMWNASARLDVEPGLLGTDYSRAFEKLGDERHKSLDYLRRALAGIEGQ